MRIRLGSLLLCGLIALAACSSNEPDKGGASVPRASTTSAGASTTSTTTADERYAVPAEITVAYVNDVMAALAHVQGELFRKYVSTRQFEPQDTVPLRAIYSDAEVSRQTEAFAKTRILPAEEYQDPIGDKRITVDELIHVSDHCISFRATIDFSPVRRSPPPPVRSWMSLERKPDEVDPARLNPTPWVIASDRLTEENGCVAE